MSSRDSICWLKKRFAQVFRVLKPKKSLGHKLSMIETNSPNQELHRTALSLCVVPCGFSFICQFVAVGELHSFGGATDAGLILCDLASLRLCVSFFIAKTPRRRGAKRICEASATDVTLSPSPLGERDQRFLKYEHIAEPAAGGNRRQRQGLALEF